MAILLGSIGSLITIFSAFSFTPEMKKQMLVQSLDKVSGNLKFMAELAKENGFDVGANKIKKFHQEIKEQKQTVETQMVDSSENRSDIIFYKGRKWVFIEGKYHLYNPQNIYEINGVRTYYKVNTQAPSVAKAEDRSDAQGAENEAESVAERLMENPLRAYTPQGFADLKQTLKEAKANMKKRNEALKAIAAEDQRFQSDTDSIK